MADMTEGLPWGLAYATLGAMILHFGSHGDGTSSAGDGRITTVEWDI